MDRAQADEGTSLDVRPSVIADMLAPRLQLDADQAKRFLDALVGGASAAEEFTFQTLDDDQTRKDGCTHEADAGAV